MFTEAEKKLLVVALMAKQSANARARAKTDMPEFQPVYDRIERELAALVMKVQAMEVVSGQGKVSARS